MSPLLVVRWSLRLSLSSSLVLWSGCGPLTYSERLAVYAGKLNEQRVASCLYYSGNAAGYFRVRGIASTGGVPIGQCLGPQTPVEVGGP